ncbi:MAG TPA: TlpA disulfide reductase family protein, partial [Candidatus Limnocylindrales bacterium]|nr:TlpA disulfide reductase family protein [Candidatus Limnocylindrales bacterium]
PALAVTHDDGTTFQLTDLDGRPVRLEELRGKLVWLNFWASWCPPCQGETPVLRDLDEQYRDRGLALVGVAVQETTIDNVREYAQRYELGYPIAFDTSADIFRLYRVYALPTQFFIGRDGTILDVVNGPLSHEDAQARIDAWLPKD